MALSHPQTGARAALVRVASTALVAIGLFSSAQAANEIVIGQVAPLSGVLASTGSEMVLGAKVYFSDVNARGGINGEPIRQVVVDDAYKVPETVRLTQQMAADPSVVALIGFAGTANITQLLQDKVLDHAHIALVSPYTGGESLRTPFNPWIFHVRAGYADETERLVEHVTTVGLKRIAVLYQNDAFGKAGLAGVEAAAKKRNLSLVATASYERNTDNVADAVNAIKAADAQAVIMVSVNKSTAAFTRDYRQAGGFAQLYNISVIDPGEIVRLAGLDSAAGLGVSQVVPSPFAPTLGITREYQKAMAQFAPGHPLSYTSFEEFIGAKVLCEALRHAGPHPTRDRVLHALETLGEYDVGGMVINFSPTNRIGSHFVDISVIGRNGKLMI